jgi:hypothetical protein
LKQTEVHGKILERPYLEQAKDMQFLERVEETEPIPRGSPPGSLPVSDQLRFCKLSKLIDY